MRRRVLFSCAATLLAASLGGRAARAEWKELGPSAIAGNGNGGRIVAIATHPTDSTLFFVAAATGGIWKNQNGTWTPLTDQMPFNAMGALAIDPSSPATLYAGTGEPNGAFHSFYGVGIYKSTDSGATWKQLAESTFGGRAISRILVHPSNGQVLFASVMRTGDVLGVGAKGHPGAQGPVGVFRSPDGGASWSALAGGLPAVPAADLAMAPGDPNTLYAAIGQAANAANGVYKSTNGGDAWTKLAGGLPANPGRISLAVAPSRANRVYALIARAEDATGSGSSTLGIYTSDDAGATWSATPGVTNFMGDQGIYDNVVAVDPKDPDVAYFGGVNIKKTANGGKSITDVTATHPDNHAFAFLPNGDLLVGQDGGVNRSTNGGSSWTRMNQGLGVNQLYAGISIHPTDAEFILGGFQDNGTNVRMAGSTSWISGVLGGDGGYTAIIKSSPMVAFATIYDAGSLYRSTNGGRNFSQSSSGINSNDRTAFYHVTVASPTDPQVLFTATHRVYKSSNQGTSWQAVSGDLTSGGSYAIRALAIAPNGQTLWAATNDNRVLVSQDGGQSFTKKLDVPGGWQRVTRELSTAPWNDQVAYVAVQRFGTDQVRMTRDLGASWAAIDGNLPDVPVNAVEAATVQGQHAVFVGTDRGVYYTCTDGRSWSRLGTTLPNTVVADVRYDGAFKRVVASTMGRGVWSIEEPSLAGCDADAGGTSGTGAGGSTGSGGASTTSSAGGSGGASTTSSAGGSGGASTTSSAGGSGGASTTSSAGGSGGASTTSSAGGSGGASTTSSAGGSGGASTTTTSGAGGTITGAGGQSSGTSTSGSGGGPGNDGGCSCRVTPRHERGLYGAGVAGLVLVLGSRRRARRRFQKPHTCNA